MDDRSKLAGKIEGVKKLALDLERICANISGSYYAERQRTSQGTVEVSHSLIYLQGLGWVISQDMDSLASSNNRVIGRNIPLLDSIVAGLTRPIYIRRDETLPPFSSDTGHYTTAAYQRTINSDAISLYGLFLSELPINIGRNTNVPSQETDPLLVFALHTILDQHELYFNKNTRFRDTAAQQEWPIDHDVTATAKYFLSNLKHLVGFSIDQLLSKYVEAVSLAASPGHIDVSGLTNGEIAGTTFTVTFAVSMQLAVLTATE